MSTPEFSRRPVIMTDESGAVVGAGFTGSTLVKSMAVIERIKSATVIPTPMRKGAIGAGSPRVLAKGMSAPTASVTRQDVRGFEARSDARLRKLEALASTVGRIFGRKI